MSQITIFLLGAPRLLVDGASVEVDTRKAIALLAYLAVTRETQSRDSLAAIFYPDNDESHARGALRRTLSALNKALGPTAPLKITRDMIGLIDSPDVWVDVPELESLLSQVERHAHQSIEYCESCLGMLERAAVLYRGDFLAGFSLRDSPDFDDWQFFQSETLRRLFSTALERLAYAYRSRNVMDKAIEYARRWLRLDTLLEDAHRELMRCYAQAGLRSAALRQYQECARILDKELGVQPLEETERLYHDIAENRFPSGSKTLPDSNAKESSVSDPISPVYIRSEPENIKDIEHRSRRLPLTGRDTQLDMMRSKYLDDASNGYFFVLEGEPGIGKTRLAEEFLTFAAQKGAIILSARCYSGENDLAYAPFVQIIRNAVLENPQQLEAISRVWLSEASRLSAELKHRIPRLPEPQPLASPGAQSLFYEGLRQTILHLTTGPAPAVLFIDDLHWADHASLDFLAYMVRRLDSSPIFLLVTWRDEDLPTQNEMRRLLAETERAGRATGLQLERLDFNAVADLARRSILHSDISDIFSERLLRESEGLPLFLVEYLDAVNQNPKAGDHLSLPVNVRDLLVSRLAAVEEPAGQILSAAAVIGRTFDFETVMSTAGRSELETVLALEQLIARRLIRECGVCDDRGGIEYDFTHDKLRTLAYEQISHTRRRLLHRRVAEAIIETGKRSRIDPTAGRIAYHFNLGGQPAQAAIYYYMAGNYSRQLYANHEALDHYQTALSLGYPQPVDLNEAVGDLQTLFGDYTAALESYRRAAASAPAPYTPQLAHKMGNVHQRRGDWQAAIARYRNALEADPPPSDALAGVILADWSLAAAQTGEMEFANSLAQDAIQRTLKADDPAALAQSYNLLGVLARRRGDLPTARQNLESALKIGHTLGDQKILAASLNNLALLLAEMGDLSNAIENTKEALALCEQLGDRHRVAALHNNLADLYHHSGQSIEAMNHLKQAVILFADVGGDASKMQPEIWKLKEW